MDFPGCAVVQRLMRTFGAVEREIIGQPLVTIGSCIVTHQVNVFVLHGTPMSFDENVFQQIWIHLIGQLDVCWLLVPFLQESFFALNAVFLRLPGLPVRFERNTISFASRMSDVADVAHRSDASGSLLIPEQVRSTAATVECSALDTDAGCLTIHGHDRSPSRSLHEFSATFS